MNWIIIADIENPRGTAEGFGILAGMPRQIARYSDCHLTPGRLKDLPLRFRLLDDDGIPYYLGRANEEGFAPLDWARGYAGCTSIEFADGDDWRTL